MLQASTWHTIRRTILPATCHRRSLRIVPVQLNSIEFRVLSIAILGPLSDTLNLDTQSCQALI
jgi:hypothetical protein